jgi:hypothetical protein
MAGRKAVSGVGGCKPADLWATTPKTAIRVFSGAYKSFLQIKIFLFVCFFSLTTCVHV